MMDKILAKFRKSKLAVEKPSQGVNKAEPANKAEPVKDDCCGASTNNKPKGKSSAHGCC